ncbi:hypothetical protein STVIR_0035 [Streptomyces viridochromogenes Tue57]|uniref:Uncharacterized protein n=1 Tax=Streptomyces viridochromogenes Tue57 TaxID=1160705 RepID=L8PR46_STRVR|nr:hypothetical protein STVIR_0035 [Streptomyces viridochromogenes Tue57]
MDGRCRELHYVSLQRQLFTLVEKAAWEAGHGEVLDAWGDDLDLMRPREAGSDAP